MIQRAADVGVPAELITAARAVNLTMPIHVAGVINEILQGRCSFGKRLAAWLVLQARGW